MERRYWTTEEVAAHYRVGINTVRDWVKKGKIAAHKAGRRVLIEQEEVERFLSESNRKGSP